MAEEPTSIRARLEAIRARKTSTAIGVGDGKTAPSVKSLVSAAGKMSSESGEISVKVGKAVSDSLKGLMKALDVPLQDHAQLAASAKGKIENYEISKLRAISTKSKLAKRVKPDQTSSLNKHLSSLADQKIPELDRFLYLLSSVVEDKSLVALLSTDTQADTSHLSSDTAASAAPVKEEEIKVKLDISTSSTSSTSPSSTSAQQPTLLKPKLPPSSSPPTTLPSTATTAMSAASQLKFAPPSDFTSTLALHRPAEDDDVVDLSYGSEIVLRAGPKGLFASIEEKDPSSSTFVASAPNAMPLVIINSKHPRDRGAVKFQDSVCLHSPSFAYLSAEASGDVNGRKTGMDTRIKWTICSALDVAQSKAKRAGARLPGDKPDAHQAVGVVKIFDRILLKSCFGTYLTFTPDGAAHCKGTEISPQQAWVLSRARIPFAPAWLRRRGMPPVASEVPVPSQALQTLNAFPSQVQEQLLLEDLLFALMGIEGNWIRVGSVLKGSSVCSFQVDPKVRNMSLVSVLNRILPLCSHYTFLNRYTHVHSRYEWGMVQHAFSGAIRAILKDYLLLVAQLEHQLKQGTLTLLRTWFFVQPSLRAMERLFRLCSATAGQTGGLCLNTIHQAIGKEGDASSRALYQHLVGVASRPYFTMLEQWLYHGVVNDPYEEFQIKWREDLTKDGVRQDFNDTYWDERYTVRQEHLPAFLKNFSDKILTTGKYLNVIRECKRSVKSPFDSRISYSANENDYSVIIDAACQHASSELLNLLLQEEQLLARLHSIKRYFHLSQGDFFVHFLDIADEELQKNVAEVDPLKLESLLELAQRTSNATTDPYKDDLSCYIQQFTLMQKLDAIRSAAAGGAAALAAPSPPADLKAIEGFTLAYQVRWPLSLVISKKTLTKYQLIFRHLFYCKHVERQVALTWRNHQSTKDINLRSAFLESYALRHRMLHFLQNLSYYMMVEVLEPNWHRLEQQLQSVKTVDDVLQHHNTFLDKCLKECLLTNHQLLKILRKLMSTCLLFSQNIERFTESVKVEEEDSGGYLYRAPAKKQKEKEREATRKKKLEVKAAHIQKIVGQEVYVNMIKAFINHFDEKLKIFLSFLRDKSSTHYDHHLANLFTRLDYNGFYSSLYGSPTN